MKAVSDQQSAIGLRWTSRWTGWRTSRRGRTVSPVGATSPHGETCAEQQGHGKSIFCETNPNFGDYIFDLSRVINLSSAREMLDLLERMQFYADTFFRAARQLARTEESLLQQANQLPAGAQIKASPFILETLAKLQKQMEEIELSVSAKGVKKLREAVTAGTAVPNVTALLSHIHLCMDDELGDLFLLNIPKPMREKYAGKMLFGESVNSAFPSTIPDIEEAGKCLALERGTACAFHLMRVLEAGLRALGKSLNDPSLDPKTNPTWERILKRCDDELRLPRNKRSADWQKDELFYSNATATLRAVKDAWRNPTLHVEISYSPKQAGEVFAAVNTFMNKLAEKLHE